MRAMRVLLLAAIAACSGKSAPSADSNETFVAFPASFQPFRTWTQFHSDGPADDGTFPAAVLGPRTQYINKVPPHGSKLFPVGTIIVEVRDSGAILAGVKRGGTYNLGGALDWEWFGLAEDPTTGAVSVNWRGITPPAGGYGGIPTEGCNDCHSACGGKNDYVCSPVLQLAGF